MPDENDENEQTQGTSSSTGTNPPQVSGTQPPPLPNPPPLAEDEEDDGIDPEGMPEGEPNVRLSKKRGHEAVAKGLLNIGMEPGIMMPSKKTQLQGFFVPNAATLVNQFRQYKFIQKKGTDRPTS